MDNGEDAQEMRVVYVAGICPSVNEETLRSVFSHCGEVTKVKLAGDPSRGSIFGFVEFVSNDCAKNACVLTGLQIGDRQIKVSMAKSPTIGGGLGKRHYNNNNTNSFANQNYYAHGAVGVGGTYGPGTGVALQRNASTFHQPMFSNTQYGGSMNQYFPMMNQSYGGNGSIPTHTKPPHAKTPIVNDPEKAAKTIHIAGVDPFVNECNIQHFFSNCGEITALRVNGKIGTTPRFAWAEFKSLEGMEMALTLDGQVMGSMRVKIQKSRSSIQNNGLRQGIAPTGSPVDVKALERAAAEKMMTQANVQSSGWRAIPAPPENSTKVARSVALGGVPSGIDEMDVLEVICRACGPCDRIQLAPDSNDSTYQFCWIQFSSLESVEKCLSLSGRVWDSDRNIILEMDLGKAMSDQSIDNNKIFVEKCSAVVAGGIDITATMNKDVLDRKSASSAIDNSGMRHKGGVELESELKGALSGKRPYANMENEMAGEESPQHEKADETTENFKYESGDDAAPAKRSRGVVKSQSID